MLLDPRAAAFEPAAAPGGGPGGFRFRAVPRPFRHHPGRPSRPPPGARRASPVKVRDEDDTTVDTVPDHLSASRSIEEEGGGGSVKLYVGNLDYDTDESRLIEAFGAFGEVTSVHFPLERRTRGFRGLVSRGFAFVTFEDRASAEMAIAMMHGTELDGRVIAVNKSTPRDNGPVFNAENRPFVKLHVGNISYETMGWTVREAFEKLGRVTDCHIPVDAATGRSRGFALVTMPAADAKAACSRMNGYTLDGRDLQVSEATPDSDAKLYVGNLPYDVTPDLVRAIFERYGEVADVTFPLDRQTGKVRGFAFVTMCASHSREWRAACDGVDGTVLRGRRLTVKKWRRVDKSKIRKKVPQ